MSVPITGTLSTYAGGHYPTHDSRTGIGGLRELADHTARNAIDTSLRRKGMEVVCLSDPLGTWWQLNTDTNTGTDADWTEFSGTPGEGLLPTGSPGEVLTTDGDTGFFSSVGLKIDQHFGTIGVASIVSTNAAFNLTTNDWYTLTLDHTATTTIVLDSPTIGQQFTLRLVQDGTGGCLVTWFGGITWAGGSAPTLSTAPGAVDVATFKCTDTDTYDGFGPSAGGGGGGGSGTPFAWGLALGGDAAVANDLALWEIAQTSGTFSRWDVISKTGPIGAALVLDIKLSSDHGNTFDSLWASTPSDRPTIADGSVSGTGSTFETTAYTAGDLLRIDIIQVGSGTAGSNIGVRLK